MGGSMDYAMEILKRYWPAASETWLWAALALVGTLVSLAVLARALFFRPFDPSAMVKSVLRIAAKTLEKGPAVGAQTFGKETGDLLRDAIGPGDKPVTDTLKSEVADILWRRWRDARWSKSHKLPQAVWQDAQRLWEQCADDIVLSIDELKAARFDPALLKQRFKEKLAAAGGGGAAGASIVSALWPVLEELYPTLIARPKAQDAVQLLMGQRMLELQERAVETAQRIDERTAETHSRVSDAHAAIVGVAGDLAEMKPEIIKQLDVVAGFENLALDHVRRLPTALVVADYGIIPYDDSRGLKVDLLSWALDASHSGPAGRLYAAAGGYGKTRLALEAVTILREEHGWRTGLLPRAALEKTDIRGEQDADARLKRFFDSRGDKGALLVLDYAEGRTAQIERVTKAAIASRGSPIRIMLLARGAGEWWEELHKESREVQLVYDQTPVAAIAGDIAPERRETFFIAAANAFAKQLADAQTSDDLLLSADWEAKPIPAKRLAAPEVGSPLSLAFEAFLHVRGVDPEDSPLAEMAREERRHWARALKIKASDVARVNDPRIDMMHRCAAVLTLMQGTERSSVTTTDKALERLLQLALDGVVFPGSSDVERASSYATVAKSIDRLYRRTFSDGDHFAPIVPDVLGEEIVGNAINMYGSNVVEVVAREQRHHLALFWVLSRMSQTFNWSKELNLIVDKVIWPQQSTWGAFTAVARTGIGRLPLLFARKMKEATLEQVLPFIGMASGGRSNTMAPVLAEAKKRFGQLNSGDAEELHPIAARLAEAKNNPRSVMDRVVSAGTTAVGAQGLLDQGSIPEAKAQYLEALLILNTDECRGDGRALETMGWIYSDLALCHSLLGESHAARQCISNALSGFERALTTSSDTSTTERIRSLKDEALSRQVAIHVESESEDSFDIIGEALEDFQKRGPLTFGELHVFGSILHNAGAYLFRNGETAKAAQYFRTAIQNKKMLAERDVDRYGADLVSSQLMLIQIIESTDTALANAMLREAHDISKEVFQKDPEGKADQMGRVLKLKLMNEIRLDQAQAIETAKEAFGIWQIILRQLQHNHLARDGGFVFRLCASIFLEAMEFEAAEFAAAFAVEALAKCPPDTTNEQELHSLGQMMVLAKEGQGKIEEASQMRAQLGLPDNFGIEIRDFIQSQR